MKKKYIVWGTGQLYQKIIDKLEIHNDEILFYIETNKTKLFFNDKEVYSFDELQKMDEYTEKSFCILVCTSYWDEITKKFSENEIQFLKKFEVIEGEKLCSCIEHQSFFKNYSKMVSFVEREISKNFIVNKDKRDIIIMVHEWGGSSIPYYNIILGLLLKFKGFTVRYILNNKMFYSDLINSEYCNGNSFFQTNKLENILEIIKSRLEIQFNLLTDFEEHTLTRQERTELKNGLYYNKVWYTRSTEINRNNDFIDDFYFSNASRLKQMIVEINPSNIHVLTGLHHDSMSLNILGRIAKSKVISSEYIRDGYSFSISSPAVLQKDIIEVFNNILDNNLIMYYLINYANNHLTKVFKSNSKTKEYKIQRDNMKSVLIPLNIFWDSASFGNADIYGDFQEWLVDTIHFLLNDCNVKVYVRQHPHEKKYKTGLEIEKLLLNKFGENRLFSFISATEEFDTYSLIESVDLILPNTSTVGLEAAMIGKSVILKSDVYYSNTVFVRRAKSIKEYKKLIKNILHHPIEMSEKEINMAKIYFSLSMMNETGKSFAHYDPEVEQLLEMDVKEIAKLDEFELFYNLLTNNKFPLENKLDKLIKKEMDASDNIYGLL